eukprot:1161919-Pelagomonas_calceolata.AAC.1
MEGRALAGPSLLWWLLPEHKVRKKVRGNWRMSGSAWKDLYLFLPFNSLVIIFVNESEVHFTK